MAKQKKTATEFDRTTFEVGQGTCKKYYAEGRSDYSFGVDKMVDGKFVYDTDRYGNNSTLQSRRIQFVRCPVINPETNKPDTQKQLSVFIIGESDGCHLKPSDPDYDRIVEALEERRKQVGNPVCSEDEYNAKRNPEAYRLVTQNREMTSKLTELEQENADLKELLNKA